VTETQNGTLTCHVESTRVIVHLCLIPLPSAHMARGAKKPPPPPSIHTNPEPISNGGGKERSSSPALSSPGSDERPVGPLSVVVPPEEREAVKVNNTSLTELKNACDDALKRVSSLCPTRYRLLYRTMLLLFFPFWGGFFKLSVSITT
jgi:hypothetical protein